MSAPEAERLLYRASALPPKVWLEYREETFEAQIGSMSWADAATLYRQRWRDDDTACKEHTVSRFGNGTKGAIVHSTTRNARTRCSSWCWNSRGLFLMEAEGCEERV